MILPENIILPVSRLSQVFNILLVNVNEAIRQVVFHVHLQLYKGDIENPKGGVMGNDTHETEVLNK